MYQSPHTMPLSHILPSEPLLLMGAGPVPIPHAVAQANGVVINHLGDTMYRIIDEVKKMAQYAFQTSSRKIMGVAGPSSAAMEMGITNLVWPGKRVLVLQNGIFGDRMGVMARAVGAEVDVIDSNIVPISLETVKEAFSKQKYDLMTMVQGETSCGILNTELPEITKFCKTQGTLTMVDAVCTLSTMPLDMDEWQIDVAITGGQKGISTIPGVSVIAFSRDAWQVIEKRDTICPHWCLSAPQADRFWSDHKYHYTAPVPGILALYEALRIICEETLEKRFLRHKMSSEALQNGVEVMGLELFIKKSDRLNSVVAIKVPNGVDCNTVRKTMATQFNVEISGAFGLDIMRIGQMGEQCRSHNLFKTLYALGMSFRQEKHPLRISKGMAAIEEILSGDENYYVT
jgi:alanine-glyoxylate transaminase / serine-glyoxylate transaminase / serine-pyruvate transaminase